MSIDPKILHRYSALHRRADNKGSSAAERAVANKKIAELESKYPGIRMAYFQSVAEEMANDKVKQAKAAWKQTVNQNMPRPELQNEFISILHKMGVQVVGDDLPDLAESFLQNMRQNAINDLKGAIDNMTSRKTSSSEDFDTLDEIDRGDIDWTGLDLDELLEEHVLVDEDDIDLIEGDEDTGDLLQITFQIPIGLLEAVMQEETGPDQLLELLVALAEESLE